MTAKTKEIEDLIAQGKTFKEIVDAGYAKGSVSRAMTKARAGTIGTKLEPDSKTGTVRSTLVKTENLDEANVLQVVPTVKQFSSVILFLAKKYTETEWNWPELDVGDWIDTYIYHTLRQHGVTLGYTTQEGKNEQGVNGGQNGS
jgi:hypothetical protein